MPLPQILQTIGSPLLNQISSLANQVKLSPEQAQSVEGLKKAIEPFEKSIHALTHEYKNLPALGGLGEPAINPHIALKPNPTIGGSSDFGGLLSQAIHQVDLKQKHAAAELTDVLIGRSDNLQQAMISASESQLGFQLLVEIRNRLVEGIQELTRLQVG